MRVPSQCARAFASDDFSCQRYQPFYWRALGEECKALSEGILAKAMRKVLSSQLQLTWVHLLNEAAKPSVGAFYS